MTSQKYFYKGRDFIQLRKTIRRLAMIIFCILAFLLFTINLPALALDWNDKEWASCPRTVEGIWISDNPDSMKRKTLNIQKKRINLTLNGDGQVLFTGNAFIEKEKFVEMVLESITKEKEVFIKLRPHMVQTSLDSENRVDCRIKVFRFNSHANAKFDKYSSWDINQLKRN